MPHLPDSSDDEETIRVLRDHLRLAKRTLHKIAYGYGDQHGSPYCHELARNALNHLCGDSQ